MGTRHVMTGGEQRTTSSTRTGTSMASAYEQMRGEKIKRNREELQSLVKVDAHREMGRKAKKKKKKMRTTTKLEEKEKNQGLPRRKTPGRGVKAKVNYAETLAIPYQVEEEEEEEEEGEGARGHRLPHRRVEALFLILLLARTAVARGRSPPPYPRQTTRRSRGTRRAASSSRTTPPFAPT